MSAVVLAALLACASAFPDRVWSADPRGDFDHDGWTERDGDCDDTDPAVQARLWFVDDDGDGFGSEVVAQVAGCKRPASVSERSGDCDDARADVHPGAAEVCDLVDANCDGDVDTHLVSLPDGRSFGTIHEALAVLPEEDPTPRVRICPGTYDEVVTVGHGVQLVGIGGSARTRLAPSEATVSAATWGVIQVLGTTEDWSSGDLARLPSARVEGLTVPSVHAWFANLEVADCVVDGADAPLLPLAGVNLGYGTHRLERVRVSHQSQSGVAASYATVELHDVEIDHNRSSVYGGGLTAVESEVHADSATRIHHNRTSRDGGGVLLITSTLSGGSTVAFNTADRHGGGLAVLADSSVVGVTLAANRAGGHGGGIYTQGGAVVRDAESAFNAAARGGGLFAASDRVALRSVTLMQNVAVQDGGNLFADRADLSWVGGRVVDAGALGGGEAGTYGWDIALFEDATITLDDVPWVEGDAYGPAHAACVIDAATARPMLTDSGRWACADLAGTRSVRCDGTGCRVNASATRGD